MLTRLVGRVRVSHIQSLARVQVGGELITSVDSTKHRVGTHIFVQHIFYLIGPHLYNLKLVLTLRSLSIIIMFSNSAKMTTLVGWVKGSEKSISNLTLVSFFSWKWSEPVDKSAVKSQAKRQ